MRSRWHIVVDPPKSPPIEARFIDLFMAIIGSLVFISVIFLMLSQLQQNTKIDNSLSSGLYLLPIPLADGFVDKPYSIAIAYRNGSGVVRWSKPQDLPPGLTFDQKNGVINGTPTEYGKYYLNISATDATNRGSFIKYEINIFDSLNPGIFYSFDYLPASIIVIFMVLLIGFMFTATSNKRTIPYLEKIRIIADSKGSDERIIIEEAMRSYIEKYTASSFNPSL